MHLAPACARLMCCAVHVCSCHAALLSQHMTAGHLEADAGCAAAVLKGTAVMAAVGRVAVVMRHTALAAAAVHTAATPADTLHPQLLCDLLAKPAAPPAAVGVWLPLLQQHAAPAVEQGQPLLLHPAVPLARLKSQACVCTHAICLLAAAYSLTCSACTLGHSTSGSTPQLTGPLQGKDTKQGTAHASGHSAQHSCMRAQKGSTVQGC